MPIFRELQGEQNHALLVPFIADPPTTTLQRLKGLTTGSLPTFVDIGNNFGSDAITEDNIISQSVMHGKQIVFMGDDTWMTLFPRHFNRSFPYPSFNVKDLHTVDNGIMHHLPQVMKQKDWDLLIAHFLGVDHCGHRYGPTHPEMVSKLKQMNDIIRDTVSLLDDKTVLFVMGDHGMTKTGDHGGESADEVKSALFIYSKSQLLFSPYEQDSVSQVDFVPTFAMLFGLPIPFSSLGAIIPELFQECDKAFLENANQVANFLDAYAAVSSQFPASLLQELKESLRHVRELHERLPSEAHLRPLVCEGYRDYLIKVKKMCSNRWAQFDVPTMVLGILILTAVVSFIMLLLLSGRELDAEILKRYIGRGVIFGAVLSSGTWFTNYTYFTFVYSTGLFCLLSVLFPFACLLKLSFNCCSQKKEIASESVPKRDNESAITLREKIESKFSMKGLREYFPSIVTVFYFLSSFSNSLVVNENHILTVLCQSLVLIDAFLFCYSSFTTKGRKFKPGSGIVVTVILLICIRFGTLWFRCREEQEPCYPSLFSTPNLNMSDTWHLVIASFCLLVPVLAVTLFLKRFSSSYDLSQLFVRYAVITSLLCIVAHWSISKAPVQMLKKLLPGNEEIAAKVSFFLCLSVVGIIFLKPISSSLALSLDRFSYGLSLNLVSVLSAFSLILCLLSGETLSVGITLVLLCAVLWTHLVCHQEYKKVYEIQLGWRCTVVWAMLSNYGFFVTGHQAVFSSIHWNAAFVTSDGNSTGKFQPALAITLETFSSQILFALGLPLLPLVYIISARRQLHLPHRISDITSYRPFLPVWSSSKASHFEGCLIRLNLSLLLFSGIKLLATVLACTFLRHHLMVWKIFAPRFVFESVSCLVTIVTTLFTYILTFRVTSSLSYYAIKDS